MAQGFLAMLAGGAMTKSGRQWFTRMLHRLRVPRGTRGTLVVISSLLVLLLASSGWWSLRLVSRYYNNRGALLQAEGNLSATIENYTRSLRAYPNNALVHYNLATAKEEIHDDDGAAEQYRAAIAEDSRLSAAYNNLARLQIRGGKPAVAIDLLRRGLKYKAAQRSDAYAFHKNLAWAYLALGLLQQSQRELRIASANLDGPALHCLQAQLIEKASPTIDAAQEWQKCIAKTGSDVGAVEPEWLALARERILTGGRS
jgi:tetratricopeptide (TPR) repeat protein